MILSINSNLLVKIHRDIIQHHVQENSCIPNFAGTLDREIIIKSSVSRLIERGSGNYIELGVKIMFYDNCIYL